MVRSAWVRGSIDDQTVAVTCSTAIFEEMRSGWTAGVEVLDDAFTMVLSERRNQNPKLELFTYYMKMLLRRHSQINLSRVWGTILKGLQTYPSNPELFKTFVETWIKQLSAFGEDYFICRGDNISKSMVGPKSCGWMGFRS